MPSLKLPFLSALLIALTGVAATPPPAAPKVDDRVDAIMGRMTLEQKIDLIAASTISTSAATRILDGPD